MKNSSVSKIINLIGMIMCVLGAIFAVILCVVIKGTMLVPDKFIAILGVVLVLLLTVFGALIKITKKPLFGVLGILVGLAIVIFSVYANVQLKKTQETLKSVMDIHVETTQVSVYVKAEDKAQSIEEAKDYDFGVLTTLDRDNTNDTVKQIEEAMKANISLEEYEGLTDLADAMMDGSVQAIIINEGYVELLADWDMEEYESERDYAAFASSLRKLTEFTIEHVVEVPRVEEVKAPESEEESEESQEEEKESSSAKGEQVRPEDIRPIVDAPRYVRDDFSYVDTGCFIVYISGNDRWGSLASRSRSDVNILAVVNTKRKQILLVSTPRDYYVPLSISGGVKDKLTHAGIYGIQCSKDTLSMLYGVDINYYFRLNFSGFAAIIDALGGITVWSDYDFTVDPVKHYVVGNNDLNGIEALAFARERHALPGGDNARGRNQMNVIISVANKMCSPAVLGNYRGILDSVNGLFETSLPYDVLASMVQDQLGSGGNWDIRSYAVWGSGSKEYTYSISSQKAYVMIPNQDSVEEAKRMINACLDGTLQ